MNTDNLIIEIDKTSLSTSEKQVLEGVVMGLSNKEIANQTFKTEKSIKIEFEVIKEKLQLNSRVKVIVHFLNLINYYEAA